MPTTKTKTATAKRTAKKSAPKKRARKPSVSEEQRHQQIQYIAYLQAEQRGFQNGSPESDWYAAEQQVDAQLS